MDFADLGDVVPVPQDDGPAPVCAIAYPPAFVRAHDLLRALLAADERSARALALTDACLKLNPANYTAWHFRRRCLVALSADGSEDGPVPTIAPERIVRDLEFAADLGGTKYVTPHRHRYFPRNYC
jgi:protein farnesyltransferase/geranylgeranyltransferase type-1 subunit alpha